VCVCVCVLLLSVLNMQTAMLTFHTTMMPRFDPYSGLMEKPYLGRRFYVSQVGTLNTLCNTWHRSPGLHCDLALLSHDPAICDLSGWGCLCGVSQMNAAGRMAATLMGLEVIDYAALATR
jgi:hypothetical protein